MSGVLIWLMVSENCLVINFTVKLKIICIHHTMENPISECIFAMATKNFIPDIDESRTHDGFNITYGAQWRIQLSCVVIGEKQKGYR